MEYVFPPTVLILHVTAQMVFTVMNAKSILVLMPRVKTEEAAYQSVKLILLVNVNLGFMEIYASLKMVRWK